MKNIIVIDLTLFNNEKLKEVADMFKELSISHEALLEDKKKGIKKLFIDITNYLVVGFTYKSNPDEIIWHENFINQLSAIQPIQLPKKQRGGTLSVDSLLDKISKFGIESLTESEKSFLDKESNS